MFNLGITGIPVIVDKERAVRYESDIMWNKSPNKPRMIVAIVRVLLS